ncbi:DUF1129 family protein [Bacillus atrophaeus]|uniref:DUF1129 family protein n=1 Tax=Bacillus atrophaeus TaxID=1452 RepID=UPI0028802844|nr:DUF1129 family protein [Bacillus atrophaeus]MDS9997903.1 DUF1129 family protein [Bacillus atrophaeus]
MLSKETTQYLNDVRVYLMTTGKSEKEVQEILDEMTVHAIEGEKEGKTAAELFGHSPKQYAQTLSKELPNHLKESLSLAFSMFVGILSYFVLNDALSDQLDYSLYKLAGYPLCVLVNMILLILVLRLTVGKKKSSFLWLYAFGMTSVALPALMMLLDKVYGTPAVSVGQTGRWIVMAAAALVIIGLCFRAGAKLPAVLPIFVIITHVLFDGLKWTSNEAQIIQSFLPFVLLIILLLIENKRTNAASRS